jgi:uncharacterized protein with LGFP repeats
MSAIDDKYFSLGGPGGFLGQPVDAGAGDAEMDTADGRGRVRDFEGGSIYWMPETGAHEVHGDIRATWADMGWERSRLRYPVSDETNTPDGQGRMSRFQGGAILWTPGGGTDVRLSNID